jgi:hypothetical protein
MQVVGPSIRAYGLCLDGERLICEPLSLQLDLLLVPHYPERLLQLARLFAALPTLMEQIWACYSLAVSEQQQRQAPPRVMSDSPLHPVPLPYPLRSMRWAKVETLAVGKRVYVGHLVDGSRRVVKFCQRYSNEAHELWAQRGLAPKLLEAAQRLPGGWQVVHLEHLPVKLPDGSGWLPMSWLVKPTGDQLEHGLQNLVPLPEQCAALKGNAQKMVAQAHMPSGDGIRYAHGDMRQDNIMVLVRDQQVQRMVVVDMEWAGVAGVATYPTLMNTRQIVWPNGARPGMPLLQKHDLELLDLQFGAYAGTAVGT